MITLAIYIICQTRGINRVIYSRIRIPGQAANQWTSTTSLKSLSKSVKFSIPDRRYQNEKSDYLSDPGAPPYFPPPLPPAINPYYEIPIEKEDSVKLKQNKQSLKAVEAAEEIKSEEESLSVAGTSSQEPQDPRILKLEAAIEALIDSNSKLTSRVNKLKLTTKK